jgi:hypothetical protein
MFAAVRRIADECPATQINDEIKMLERQLADEDRHLALLPRQHPRYGS